MVFLWFIFTDIGKRHDNFGCSSFSLRFKTMQRNFLGILGANLIWVNRIFPPLKIPNVQLFTTTHALKPHISTFQKSLRGFRPQVINHVPAHRQSRHNYCAVSNACIGRWEPHDVLQLQLPIWYRDLNAALLVDQVQQIMLLVDHLASLKLHIDSQTFMLSTIY